jgi:hypothetical protein
LQTLAPEHGDAEKETLVPTNHVPKIVPPNGLDGCTPPPNPPRSVCLAHKPTASRAHSGQAKWLNALTAWRSCQLRSHSRTSQHYRVHKSLLLQPAQACPISRPVLIISTLLRLGPPSGHFPFDFPTNNLYVLLYIPCPSHSFIYIA